MIFLGSQCHVSWVLYNFHWFLEILTPIMWTFRKTIGLNNFWGLFQHQVQQFYKTDEICKWALLIVNMELLFSFCPLSARSTDAGRTPCSSREVIWGYPLGRPLPLHTQGGKHVELVVPKRLSQLKILTRSRTHRGVNEGEKDRKCAGFGLWFSGFLCSPLATECLAGHNVDGCGEGKANGLRPGDNQERKENKTKKKRGYTIVSCLTFYFYNQKKKIHIHWRKFRNQRRKRIISDSTSKD